jgi:hypothetical protein
MAGLNVPVLRIVFGARTGSLDERGIGHQDADDRRDYAY